MKNLVKVMFGGIIVASVLAGGVALAHGWSREGYGWEHGGMYGSGCRNLQQVPEGTDAGDEEDTAFQECSIMAFRDECTMALGWDEMQKARTEVLAELSSKTVEQIEQDTKTHSKRALLQKL